MQVFKEGPGFDYAVTLSDAVDMPVNIGMQFVHHGRYPGAVAFLEDVLAVYPFNETFVSGQVSKHQAASLCTTVIAVVLSNSSHQMCNILFSPTT